MRKSLIFITLSILAIFTYAKTTTSITDGTWNNGPTWDNGVPVNGDIVIIDHNVSLNSNFSVADGSLTINSGASLIQSGNRDIDIYNALGVITNYGTLTFDDFDGQGTIINYGTINIDESNIYNSGKLINHGNFYLTTGTFSTNAVLRNYGTFETSGSTAYTLSCSGDSILNEGTITTHSVETSGGFIIANSGTFTTTSTQKANLTATTIYNTGTFNTGGNLQLNDGSGVGSNFYNLGVTNVSGQVLSNSNTTVYNYSVIYVTGNFVSNGDVLNNGEIHVSSGIFRNYHNTVSSTTCGYINLSSSGTYYNHSDGTTTGNLTICCATLTNYSGVVGGSVVVSCTNPCPITLPVELVSFDANYQDKQENVILTWETQNEQNFSHFEVEKSIDNANFYDISTVNALTNNQQAKNYSTYDEEINAKIMFYRLKMIDLDGEVNYSKIVSINVNIRNSDILIYPNPSSNENITIELYSKELNKNLDISVIDVNGKIVLTQKFKVNNYIEKFELNTNNLSQGIYFIKIHGENLTKNFKHVIK